MPALDTTQRFHRTRGSSGVPVQPAGREDCITFVGDLYAPGAFQSRLSLATPWVCNLEGPVTKARVGTTGKINLKMEALDLEESLGSFPTAVSLANNHILDYSDAGLLDTLHLLESAGVQGLGLPVARGAPATPAHIRCAGLDVVLLGYVCSSTHPAYGVEYSPLLVDDGLIKNDIRQAKQEGADRVVLCLHWGQEEVSLPTPPDRLRARQYAAAGADLIIGHHSHCIQRWELVGDCPVFYGLGNFIMPALRVPTEFDETGSPRSWHERRQYSWNRKSMMVVWSPTNRQWSVRFAHFRRGVLTGIAGGSVDRLQLTGACDDAYDKSFRQTARRSLLRTALTNYFSRPRLPARRHFRALLGMLGSATKLGEANRG